MDNTWIWAGVGGGILVALLSTSKAGNSYIRLGNVSDADVTNTARMLLTETGFNRDPKEMASIVQVAINRAAARGTSLSQVVAPSSTWNNGPIYARRFSDAASSPKLQAAKTFVLSVLDGQWPNLIGNRKMFVHPGGMPIPPCASNRVNASTFMGNRCLPSWVLVNPVRVGGAQFA